MQRLIIPRFEHTPIKTWRVLFQRLPPNGQGSREAAVGSSTDPRNRVDRRINGLTSLSNLKNIASLADFCGVFYEPLGTFPLTRLPLSSRPVPQHGFPQRYVRAGLTVSMTDATSWMSSRLAVYFSSQMREQNCSPLLIALHCGHRL